MDEETDVRCSVLLALALVSVGCTDTRLCHAPPSLEDATASYRVGCGDVLSVTFVAEPTRDGIASVGLDGQLKIGPLGVVPVDGLTTEEIRLAVAEMAKMDTDQIQVALLESRSGRVYLSGPENQQMRALAYGGPEPVVEFLWRVGAVQPGCSDLRDVTVVRPNVALGEKPEIFDVDVASILNGDHQSNVRLQPSDFILVGETRRSSFSRLLPDWLRPLYDRLMGIWPHPASALVPPSAFVR